MKLDRILRMDKVTETVGVCPRTIYAWIKQDRFPPPVKLGPQAVGWREHEILEWLSKRPQAF